MKEGWKIVKLGDIATYVNGYAFKPTDWSHEGLPIIRIQNLNSEKSEFHCYNGEILPRYRVKKGDVLISWSASLGVYIWNGEDAWLNQHIFKVVFDKYKINVKYFVYVIESLLTEMKKLVHGATMQHITKDKFDNIDVPVPSLTEQQRIVTLLDAAFAKIDALKANAEKNLQNAKDLFQAALKKEFEGNNLTLGDVLNLRRGHDLTHGEMLEGIIPVAGSGGVIGYHNVASPISPCITVGRSGSVGKVYVYDSCWAHNTVLYVDDFKGNYPYYLAYLLISLDLAKMGGGCGVPTLNRNNLHPMKIGFNREVSKQKEIVSRLDALNERCKQLQENYTKTIALCDDLKQALLTKAFNGEL